MGSLGELFIQLAFEGDTSKADKFINKTKDIIKQTDIQIKKNRLLLQYLKDIKEAQGDTARQKLIKDTFVKELQKLNLTSAVETKEQTKLSTAVKNTVGSFMKYAAVVTTTVYAVKRLTDSLIQQNQQFLNLTRTSDISLKTFQKWNNIGKVLGVDGAAEQIKSLNDRLFELKLTGANAEGFMLAGIMPTNAEDVMRQLRNRVSGMNDTAAGFLLRRMGLDENMLHILRLSQQDFEALNNEIKDFQLTAGQRKEIQSLNMQLQIAAIKLQYLKDRAVLAILPHFTRFLTTITKITVNVGRFINNIRKAHPFILNLIKLISVATVTFLAFSKAIKIVLATLIQLATALIRNPATAGWILALTALVAILDDIATYFMGGESFTGDILKWLSDFNNLPLNDFIDKLENVLNHPVPEWLKVLVTALKLQNDINTQHPVMHGMSNAFQPFNIGEMLGASMRNDFGKGGNVTINQNNNIHTTEAAQTVMDSLLPLKNSIEFANYNTIPGAI